MLRQDQEMREQTGERAKVAGGSANGVTDQRAEGRPAATAPSRKAAASLTPDEKYSERADIARRVAAFRERQLLLQRQREEYYDAMMAKTRAELRSDPRTSRR